MKIPLFFFVAAVLAGNLLAQSIDLPAPQISQNVYLFCASEGLATGARGSVDRSPLAQKLKLRQDQLIVLAQSVGYPKSP